MRRIVTIIGTDGSGKTSLSDAVVATMNDAGRPAVRLWLGAESVLAAPIRSGLKLLWKPRRTPNPSTAASRGYDAEIHRKNAIAQRFAWATPLYIFVLMTDYRLQFTLKLRRTRRATTVIADRYLFDVAVNLGLALGWTPERVVEFIQRSLGRFPLPQVRVFLRVEPEVSMARKDDIPDINYLRLRLRYYDAIARAFGFLVLDGSLPIHINVDRVTKHLVDEYAKPYVHYVHANNIDVGGADNVLVLMAAHARRYRSGKVSGYRTGVSLRLRTGVVDAHIAEGTAVFLHEFVRPQLSAGANGLVSFILRAPATATYFWRLFRREQPDLVHVNDLYDFVPAAVARLQRIPVVYHVRMIQEKTALRSAFAHLVRILASTSISVSDAVRSSYGWETTAGHSAVVIHDLGNARLCADQGDVTEPSPRLAELPDFGRMVAMVGRVEAWKGQDVFLKALRSLPEDVRAQNVFVLVGGPVPGKEIYFERVLRSAQDLGVFALGTRTDVPAILRSADISVHCAIAPDPFPGVVIESLLAGCATIGADAGGVREMIVDGSIGILTAPGNDADLAAALAGLLAAQDPPRRRFGKFAREQALALVDPDMVDSAISSVYEAARSNPVRAEWHEINEPDSKAV